MVRQAAVRAAGLLAYRLLPLILERLEEPPTVVRVSLHL